MVDGIYRRFRQKLGCDTMREIPPDVLDAASLMSLREAKVRLECAIASAVAQGRSKKMSD